ncbi:MAG: class I SAM-dependent methyltransferase [Burkholderiales bacterium]|nr:class I SAM-dependent methyltransferase [Burkholderiales bacterium]
MIHADHVVRTEIERLVDLYPDELRKGQRSDVGRIFYHVNLVRSLVGSSGRPLSECAIMDVGGGIGLFSIACKALGFGKVILVDDFRDPINDELGDGILNLHRSRGIEVYMCDVAANGVPPAMADLDVVTLLFDTIEHWHHSPKRALHQLVAMLRSHGWIIIGVPNCVNLRKRITVPFGRGKWSQMADWYERERFRGMCANRMWRISCYIARDLGLKNVRIIGRNWAGFESPTAIVRWATRTRGPTVANTAVALSESYMLGQKA